MATIGSILHGAYGDYYEQMICLRAYKQSHPQDRVVAFFASESRRAELSVFDPSFADELHPATALPLRPVDRFLQYQVRDAELRTDVLDKLPDPVRAKIDLRLNLKPWSALRRVWCRDPELCDLKLGPAGRDRLADCMRQNGVEEGLFEGRFTVGFLWRYRRRGGAVSHRFQTREDAVVETKSELLSHLARRHDAHIIVAGMNVKTTDENRERTDCKFTQRLLDVDPSHCTYLKGLSWGLELEIMRRCSLCLVMASGFSEALWMKRRGGGIALVDATPHYLAKLLWNRMPFFAVLRPSELWFHLRQPHTPARVLRYLRTRGLLRTKRGALVPTGT